MIIIKLLGGLGNQLFQYAAAKALAEKNRTVAKLDLSGFEQDALRNFELGLINVNFRVAPVEEIDALKVTTSFKRIKQRIIPHRVRRFYKQPYFHFDPDYFKLPSDVYIQGYFQSEKYFSPIAGIIREEFNVYAELPTHLAGIVDEMKSQHSVAVHIRRGDYKNPNLLKVHGILSPDYYHRAINLLKENFKDLHFYIFSDDPKVARNEFDFERCTIVSGSVSTSPIDDFFLMSQCHHNIIANSSFSWWAAWLNNNPDKMVVAPKKWFNDGPKDTNDLLPSSWIKV